MASMDIRDVLGVLETLERARVQYAVFGGLAMAAHGFDRATRDLDLFVRPDDDNVERLRQALFSAYGDPSIDAIRANDVRGDYAVVQYGLPEVDYTIDMVSRVGDAFRFEDLDVQRVSAGDVVITVVSPETLYRMKRDSVRLRDRDDAQRLSRAFGFTIEERPDMPLTRYRTIEEIPESARAQTALDGLTAACDASSLSRTFGHTSQAPRGVRRFRSIEGADEYRQRWEIGRPDPDDDASSHD